MNKKIFHDKDCQCGLIVFLMGVAGWLYTHATIHTTNALVASGISADFYPKLLFILLCVCGVILFIQGAMRPAEDQVPFPRTDWKRILITFVLLLAYAYLMQYTGFIISSIVFMVVFMLFLGERKILNLILVPVIGSLLIYLLFGKIFMISLPTTPFLSF